MGDWPLKQDVKTIALDSNTVIARSRPFQDGVRVNAQRVRSLLCELEHVLYRLVIAPLVAFLPAPLAYTIACLRGDVRYRVDKHGREAILRNLEDVLGEQLSASEREYVTRDFFRRRACEAVDVTRLIGSGHALRRLVEIQGLEHLEAARAAGKGIIVCTAHYGQFAGAYSLLGAAGFPVTSVGNWPETDDPTLSWMRRVVTRLFYTGPYEHHRRRNIQPGRAKTLTAIQMAEALRANEVITIPIDAPIMDPDDLARTVQVDFLGQRARLLAGVTLVAKRTGAQVLTGVIRRSVDWRHQVLEISPPVVIEGDPVAAFKRCVAKVEAPIRAYPAHWDFWEARQILVNMGLVQGEVVKCPVYRDRHPSSPLPASCATKGIL